MQSFAVADRTRTPQSNRHVLGRGEVAIRELVKNKAVLRTLRGGKCGE
jgi:hypothetical protein